MLQLILLTARILHLKQHLLLFSAVLSATYDLPQISSCRLSSRTNRVAKRARKTGSTHLRPLLERSTGPIVSRVPAWDR
ncbi:hypothetical protein F5Y11DRAFT_113523 [Daldinia sp. FL1419]|nr:hypothetical protein F5Y11DRAFT_113523 [Daldinia sp. FL1419]